MRPAAGTYPEYYNSYIALIGEKDVMSALLANHVEIIDRLNTVPAEKGNFAYASGKWTGKQLITHITDTERILSYRALRFARNDQQQPLPFDEDHYAANANADLRTLPDLIEEFDSVRRSTLTLYESFSAEVLERSGQTAIGKTTVLAIGFMICGHALHHCNILRERYLKNYSSIKI